MFNSVWGEDEMWRAIRLFLLMSRVIFVFSAVTRVPSSGPFHARFSHRNRSCFTAENSHLSIREVAFLLLIGPAWWRSLKIVTSRSYTEVVAVTRTPHRL